VDNGAPFGGKGALGLSRLSVWWLRLGIAWSLCGQLIPGQRRARTNAPGHESRCSHSTRSQRSGTEKTHQFLDRLLQSPASSRSLRSTRPRADLLAEQSAFAGAITPTEVSVRVEYKAGAQPWPHQMARPRTFCRTSLCWPMDRAQKHGRWHLRSLSRFPSHWLAL